MMSWLKKRKAEEAAKASTPDVSVSAKVEQLYDEVEERKSMHGRTVEGVIVSVESGVLGDFIKPEKLKNPDRADRKAVQLIVKTPDDYEIKKAMVVSSHHSSSLQKYFKKYGDYPKPGMKIPLEYDGESGFWRVAID